MPTGTVQYRVRYRGTVWSLMYSPYTVEGSYNIALVIKQIILIIDS